MKHFLDFGTHYFRDSACGNGILQFERSGYFGPEVPHQWNVYTFEASKQIAADNAAYIQPIADRFTGFQAFHAAVASYDGTIAFRWCPNYEGGSNCLSMHIAEVIEHGAEEYEVEAMDAGRIVREIVAQDPNAELTIKCDIEGSEFTVLPRILEIEGVGRWVKEIFVEWHHRFWRDSEDLSLILGLKARIEQLCEQHGITLHDWQ
jgi:FkbM family methyltransferase